MFLMNRCKLWPIKKYYKYFNYVFKHQWYVMLECFKVGLYWRGLIHDWDKFLPSRFIPYANQFHDQDYVIIPPETCSVGDTKSYRAFLLHRKCSQHHWEYWCYPKHTGDPEDKLGAWDMSEPALKELVCDWKGAMRACGKEVNIQEYYFKHRHQFWMSTDTHTRLMEMVTK